MNSPKHPEVAERKQQAFDLRKAGASYRAIAQSLGVTHTTARRYVEGILADLAKQTRGTAEQYRTMQLERLQDMVLALMPQVRRGDVQAARALLGVMEREAKLLGIDAPTRIDIYGRLRAAAIAEGLDPDEAVREAEEIVAGL